MSVKLMAAALESALPANEKLVMVTLCNFVDDEGKWLYPSMETVAQRASMSKRTVQRIMSNFRERKLLLRAEKEPHEKYRSEKYRIDAARIISGDVLDAEPCNKGDKLTPSPDDTDVTSGVTNEAQNHDTSVTQYVKNHDITVSSSNTDLSLRDSEEDGRDETPPLLIDDDLELQARDVIVQYHALEQELLGANPSYQRIHEHYVDMVVDWLKLGMDEEFMLKRFKCGLQKLAEKGRSSPHFNYWRDVMPDNWKQSDRYKAQQEQERIQTVSEPFDATRAASTLLERHIIMPHVPKGADVPAWAASQMQMLREDERWKALCTAFAKRFGEATLHRWLDKCAPIVLDDAQMLLVCPSRMVKDHITNHHLRDLRAMLGSICSTDMNITLVL